MIARKTLRATTIAVKPIAVHNRARGSSKTATSIMWVMVACEPTTPKIIGRCLCVFWEPVRGLATIVPVTEASSRRPAPPPFRTMVLVGGLLGAFLPLRPSSAQTPASPPKQTPPPAAKAEQKAPRDE